MTCRNNCSTYTQWLDNADHMAPCPCPNCTRRAELVETEQTTLGKVSEFTASMIVAALIAGLPILARVALEF